MSPSMHRRKTIILSAPSGAGKTTIVKHLLLVFAELSFSVSATTRRKRGATETDGKDYYFLTPEAFKDKIAQNELVEWEEVYKDVFYGTLKTEIERIWKVGNAVVFDVDVQGGIKLKDYFGDDALAIFVRVPDLSTLAERLKKRSTESEESLRQRLEKAKYEMTFEPQFDITLLNDHLPKVLKTAERLVKDFLRKDRNS